MTDLVFPLRSEQQREAIHSCPVCHAPIGRTFAFIDGGSLAEDVTEELGVPEQSTGFLSIGVHGAHSGGLNEPSAHLDIFTDGSMGQFERSFCSIACLRAFLNSAVDELEARLSREGAV
jgi:hypothetical protein